MLELVVGQRFLVVFGHESGNNDAPCLTAAARYGMFIFLRVEQVQLDLVASPVLHTSLQNQLPTDQIAFFHLNGRRQNDDRLFPVSGRRMRRCAERYRNGSISGHWLIVIVGCRYFKRAIEPQTDALIECRLVANNGSEATRMDPLNLVGSQPGQIKVGHLDWLAEQVVGFNGHYLRFTSLRVQHGLTDRRQIQAVERIPKCHLIAIEVAEATCGRVQFGSRRPHNSVRFQVFVSSQEDRLQHGLVQKIEAHPFGNNHVHLNAFRQVNLLRFAVNDLIATIFIVNRIGEKTKT